MMWKILGHGEKTTKIAQYNMFMICVHNLS